MDVSSRAAMTTRATEKDACRLCVTAFREIGDRYELLVGPLRIKPSYTKALEALTGCSVSGADELTAVCGSCRGILNRYCKCSREADHIRAQVKTLSGARSTLSGLSRIRKRSIGHESPAGKSLCTYKSPLCSLKPKPEPQHQSQLQIQHLPVRKKFVTMAPVVWSADSVQSAVYSLKPKPQSEPQHAPPPRDPQCDNRAVKKKLVTMAPVVWSSESVQSAVCSLKPGPQSLLKSRQQAQPTDQPCDDVVVRKKLVTMAPVAWSPHSVQSAVCSLKPKPQTQHLNQPTTFLSDDVVDEKPKIQFRKDLRHVASQTDPADRRSERNNICNKSIQTRVLSRDVGVCTHTFPLNSPILFLQPTIVKTPRKRARHDPKEAVEEPSECSLPVLDAKQEDST